MTTATADSFTYKLMLAEARHAGHLQGALGIIIAKADSYLAVYDGQQPHHADQLRKGLAEVSRYAARILAEHDS